jgi:acyl-CoA synthetase (AMP-forming)/AMP-acid ligase II
MDLRLLFLEQRSKIMTKLSLVGLAYCSIQNSPSLIYLISIPFSTFFAKGQTQVTAMTAGLSGRGFQKGDVFAICTPNVPEYAILFLAVTSLGGVVTTANPAYTVEKLVDLFRDAGVKFLLTTLPFIDKMTQAAAETGIQEIFVLGETSGATPFSTLLQSNEHLHIQAAIHSRLDVAALHYSSGTTGQPKGIMLTHYNIVANLLQVSTAEAITEDDIVFCAPPFFHVFGMMIMLITIHAGATLISMPQFNPEQFLQLLQTYRPSNHPALSDSSPGGPVRPV